MGLSALMPTLVGAGCDGSRSPSSPGVDQRHPVLDLSFRITEQFRPFALIAPGFEQVDETDVGRIRGLRRADEVPVAPFVAVELGVEAMSEAGVAVGLVGSDGDFVLAAYDPGKRTVSIEVRRLGRTTAVADAEVTLEAPFGFAFVLCENQVTAVADTGKGWQPLVTSRDGVSALVDLRDPATLAEYAFAFGTKTDAADVVVRTVRAGAFGYTGLRDPHLVQRPDGSALVQGGKVYLTFTCAGMGFFQQAHWGVFTLDLGDPTRLEQVAQLYSRRDGLLLGDHAGQLIVDDARPAPVGVSSWGDFAFDGVHVRHAASSEDLLQGVHLLETEPLDLPTDVSSWDPSFTRTDDRWYVAFVESPSQDPFVFHPALAVGLPGKSYADDLELVAADDTLREGEGTIIQQVDGAWHVLASDAASQTYPVYDLAMKALGTLDAPYGTNIPHPQVVNLPGGAHLMVTFDGTQYAEEVLGYGGHGDVVVMAAQ
ncbi:MAG: hypothetical protein H0T14_08085 [Nocardioidaceae bacterium]|nr:hypothetical protein [Nocardioidaceae bacterium]